MRYALLSYGDSDEVGAPSIRERATGNPHDEEVEVALRAAGIVSDDLVLAEADTATTVRIVDGDLAVRHGPASASAGQLGRVLVIDVDHLDAALEVAGRCMGGGFGLLEVRPVSTWFPGG